MKKRSEMAMLGVLICLLSILTFYGIIGDYAGDIAALPMMICGIIIAICNAFRIWRGESSYYKTILTFIIANSITMMLVISNGIIPADENMRMIMILIGAFVIVSALWIGSDCSEKIMDMWAILLYIEMVFFAINIVDVLFNVLHGEPFDVGKMMLLVPMTIVTSIMAMHTFACSDDSDDYFETECENPRHTALRNVPAFIIITMVMTTVVAVMMSPVIFSFIGEAIANCNGGAIDETMKVVSEFVPFGYIAGCFIGLAIEYGLFYRVHRDHVMAEITATNRDISRTVIVSVLMASAVCVAMVLIPFTVQLLVDQSIVITMLMVIMIVFVVGIKKHFRTP